MGNSNAMDNGSKGLDINILIEEYQKEVSVLSKELIFSKTLIKQLENKIAEMQEELDEQKTTVTVTDNK